MEPGTKRTGDPGQFSQSPGRGCWSAGGVRVPAAVGTQGHGVGEGPAARRRRPFPGLQMGLTKITVQVYRVLTK